MRNPNIRRYLVAAALISATPLPVWAWEGSTFKVCADPNNPPYSDEQGRGFENKIAELFAKSLGKKLEYAWFPQRMGFIRNTLKSQLPNSREYKCDVVIGLPTGIELAATTKAYYRSTYALVFPKRRGWDDIKSAQDLGDLSEKRKGKLKIAMFDGSPATTWLLKHHLVEHAIPYQTMTGNASINTAETLEKDMTAGKLDMAIVWGPIAGYLQHRSKSNTYTVIPLHSEEGVRFEFPMSMGVRFPDKERKEELNGLIDQHAMEIARLLREHRVPLVEATETNGGTKRD
jgi:mxaJ protein